MTKQERDRVIDLVNRSVHSRARVLQRTTGYIKFYGKDSSSPTGVTLIGTCPLTEEYEDLIRETKGSISPLSPEERC